MTTADIERVQQYVAHTVLRRMGMAGQNFMLTPAKLGERNRVFYLTVDEGPPCVLKAFTSKTRLQNTVLGSRFLLRYGIAAPTVLFSDASAKTFKKFGSFFLCEERIQGIPVLTAAPEHETIKVVASFFSRLHGLQSSRWGSFRSPRRFGFRTYMLRKIRERIAILEASGTFFQPGGGPAIARWFEQRREAFSAFGEFSLCHGDVNPSNIILTPDRRAVLIDTEALKYLPFLIEYYRLQFYLCRDNTELQQEFSRTYFADAPKTRLTAMQRYATVYQAFVLLEFAWYYNKKLKHCTNDESTEAKNYMEYKEKALSGLFLLTGL